MRLMVFLLGSQPRRRFFERAGVSLIIVLAPKYLSEAPGEDALFDLISKIE
jgi:hypothetical protein